MNHWHPEASLELFDLPKEFFMDDYFNFMKKGFFKTVQLGSVNTTSVSYYLLWASALLRVRPTWPQEIPIPNVYIERRS